MAMYDMRLETMQPALAIEDVELAGSLSGYASVFGLPDLRNDVVGRGALARSLAKSACRACGCSGSMMRRSNPRVDGNLRGCARPLCRGQAGASAMRWKGRGTGAGRSPVVAGNKPRRELVRRRHGLGAPAAGAQWRREGAPVFG
nr:hypothetical protein [Brucella intermedia]